VEHNRWLAERLVNGWQFGKRSDERKLRSAIVDWNHLGIDEAAKDYAQVDDLFEWLHHDKVFALAHALDAKDTPPRPPGWRLHE